MTPDGDVRAWGERFDAERDADERRSARRLAKAEAVKLTDAARALRYWSAAELTTGQTCEVDGDLAPIFGIEME